MAILYCGDLHGRDDALTKVFEVAEQKNVSAIVQVGDFGIGFPDDTWRPFFKNRAEQGWSIPIYTVGGNHDNWRLLYQLMEEQGNPNQVEVFPNGGLFFVPRGNLVEIEGISHLFIGGAESTDQYRRKEGLTWWREEQPSAKEFEKFFDALENQKPEVVVAHELPLRVDLYRQGRNQSYTPVMLEDCLKRSKHQPKRYFGGHHHTLEKWKIGKTKFYCCGLHGEYWLHEKEDRGGE